MLDCTLPELHEIIQTVMGWENKHPYRFEVAGTRYGDPARCSDGRRIKLSHLVKQGERQLEYVYDFDDNWRHTVEIESGFQPEKTAGFPVCLEGKGCCPPGQSGTPIS